MTPLVSIKEASELLGGVPVKTLYQWRHRGEGPPSIRVGRHVRYRPEQIEAWISGLPSSGTAGDAA